jgi:hypothetical protein
MPKRTGTEIFRSNGQTETGAETEYTTLQIISLTIGSDTTY